MQAVHLIRAEQLAALKEPETAKDLASVPADKNFDLPFLQLPEANVRQILEGYTEDALQSLYDRIVAYEEANPIDAPANHDSPEAELADASAQERRRQKTSIPFLKTAVVYLLNEYFWSRVAEEAESYVPGYISSYPGNGKEFLGLQEGQVRTRLSGFEPQALEDLLQAIDRWKVQKPKEKRKRHLFVGVDSSLSLQ
jgi:hypothetical protein